jgi:hypothetical protein
LKLKCVIGYTSVNFGRNTLIIDSRESYTPPLSFSVLKHYIDLETQKILEVEVSNVFGYSSVSFDANTLIIDLGES